MIKKPFRDNKREKIIENNFQFEINEKSRNNNFNEDPDMDEKIKFYMNYNRLKKFDFRSDIHTNYFKYYLGYKSFESESNNNNTNNTIINEKDELNEDLINIVNNNEEKQDDNILFKNNYNFPLNRFKNRNIFYDNQNENEIIDKEDSKYGNHIYHAVNEQDNDNSDLEAKFTNSENDEVRSNSNAFSLENSRISSFNEEKKKKMIIMKKMKIWEIKIYFPIMK